MPNPHLPICIRMRLLHLLRRDDGLVILLADKGWATVFMDRNVYDDKLHDMLSDEAY